MNELMITINDPGRCSWLYYKTNKSTAEEAFAEFQNSINFNDDNIHYSKAVLRDAKLNDIDEYIIDKDNVYVLYIDDHHTNPYIEGVYSTEEKAREAFKKILLNSYWPKDYPDYEDMNGRTFEECIEAMNFGDDNDYMYVEEHEVR